MASIGLNFIYGSVLVAALFHALWNALIKGSPDKLLSAIGITGFATLLAVLSLPWMTQPALASWPCLATSLVLQVTYMRLVAKIYRESDMSVSYPVMRGTAPLLVALASAAFFQDALSPAAMAGVGTICAGILCLGWPSDRGSSRPSNLKLALLNALVIASYTLVDGTGARLSEAPASYTMWVFLLQGTVMVAMAMPKHRQALFLHVRTYWKAAVLGGFGTVISYGVALWAMTLAPIAIIAALRETSILFGVLISGIFLHERLTAARMVGACILVLGAIVLRLAP
ncbi:MAG TPA: DMT family transporter [Castellaniella sp.]|uniref:DMT family transporter n=1 Tax=Castellaniella sp. TaxID=1955812 RepID=UPI002EE2F8E2